jgi:hypothetical protein
MGCMAHGLARLPHLAANWQRGLASLGSSAGGPKSHAGWPGVGAPSHRHARDGVAAPVARWRWTAAVASIVARRGRGGGLTNGDGEGRRRRREVSRGRRRLGDSELRRLVCGIGNGVRTAATRQGGHGGCSPRKERWRLRERCFGWLRRCVERRPARGKRG